MGKQNLFLQSRRIDLTWVNQSLAIAAPGATAPDGTATAQVITDTIAGGPSYYMFHQVPSGITVGLTYTASVYVKAGTLAWILIGVNGNLSAYFNVSTGQLGTVLASVTGARITPAPNGYYKCSVTYVATATTDITFRMADSDGNAARTGTGTSTLTVWQAQVVQANWEGEDVLTTAAQVGVNTPPYNMVNFAGQNLVLQSEAQNSGTWGKANLAVNADQFANPIDGAVTMDLLTDSVDGGAVTHQTSQSITCAKGSFYTQSVWVKANGTQWFALAISGSGAYFDLLNGVVGVGAGPGFIRSSIKAYGNGIYRCSWTCLCDTGFEPFGARSFLMYMANSNGNVTYQGDGTRKAYVWGAALVQANWEGDYVATTTVAVGTNSPPPNMIPLAENLVLRSDALNDAAWTKSGCTIGQDVAANPIDAASTADSIIEDGTNGLHYVTQSMPLTAAGLNYTQSVWVKAGAQNFAYIGSGGYGLCINLTTGAFVTAAVADYHVEQWPNGWWRIWLTRPGTTSATTAMQVFANNALNTSPTYQGTNGTTAIYVYGTQMVHGASPGNYVSTGASAVNNGSIPYAVLPAQNLLPRSEQFNDVAWNVAVNCSVSPDVFANPVNGNANADAVVENGVNSIHQLGQLYSFKVGQPYTFSIWVRAATRAFAQIQINGTAAGNLGIDLTTGATAPALGVGGAIGYGAEPYANGWWRVWVTKIADSASTGAVVLSATSLTSGSVAYQGVNGTNGIYVWGAQLVDGYSPGNYAPTGAAAINFGAMPRLVPLEQNLSAWSEDVSQWGFKGVGVTATANTVDTLAPGPADGYTGPGASTQTASKVVYDGSSAAGAGRIVDTGNTSVNPGAPISSGIWIKVSAGTRAMRATDNIGAGGVLGSVAFTATTSWQFVSMAGRVAAVSGTFQVGVADDTGVNSACTFYVWGAQSNLGASLSSYEKTTSVLFDRGAIPRAA